jgi:phosphate starvation-inducible PhoH-like protein
MRSNDITFCVGPAGTGKTFLAIAEALYLVLSKKMRKLVLTRPVVEAGESLGFLPGDLAQ